VTYKPYTTELFSYLYIRWEPTQPIMQPQAGASGRVNRDLIKLGTHALTDGIPTSQSPVMYVSLATLLDILRRYLTDDAFLQTGIWCNNEASDRTSARQGVPGRRLTTRGNTLPQYVPHG